MTFLTKIAAKIGLKAAFGWISGNSQFLVLLILGAVAAYLYADGAAVRRDRERITATADLICSAAGVDFAASASVQTSTKGKRVFVAHPRGAICLRTVRDLAAFKADTSRITAETLTAAMNDRDAKSGHDAARAATDARAARAATERMEKADAEVDESNRVDRSWFGAFNDLAGLRQNR